MIPFDSMKISLMQHNKGYIFDSRISGAEDEKTYKHNLKCVQQCALEICLNLQGTRITDRNLSEQRHDLNDSQPELADFNYYQLVDKKEVGDALMRKLASAHTKLFHCHVAFVLLVA